MIPSLCLVCCALTVAQAADRAEWQLTPQLSAGLEVVYHGTYLEETLIPNVQHQRHYRLEANLLVLEAQPKEWRVALMTAMSLHNPRQALTAKQEGPMSVRLELASIDVQGCVRAADKKPIQLPLKGPQTLESGFVAASPLFRVGKHFLWEVPDPGRPAQRWHIVGTEACGGTTCIKVVGWQQSADWDHVRADQSAWRRQDTLWLLPQLNLAQKVERIIEWRDPAREQPSRRTTVRYELDSRTRYPDRLFEERRQEVLRAKKFYDDVEPLLQQPAQQRPRIESMLQRVATHLNRSADTHYRKAFVHLKTILENARKGESLVANPAEDPYLQPMQALQVGQHAPDFVISSLTDDGTVRLQAFQGKPVLVLFYNPATSLGREVIVFARDLACKQPGAVAVMALAVTTDAEIVRQQHKVLRLPFPVLDGNGMRLTFGADETPRLVLLDGQGMVRFAQTGWGPVTPDEILEELRRCGKKGP